MNNSMQLYYEHIVFGYFHRYTVNNSPANVTTLCVNYIEEESLIDWRTKLKGNSIHSILDIREEKEQSTEPFKSVSITPKQFYLHRYYFNMSSALSQWDFNDGFDQIRFSFLRVIKQLNQDKYKTNEVLNVSILQKICRKFLQKHPPLSTKDIYRYLSMLPANDALVTEYINYYINNEQDKVPLVLIKNIYESYTDTKRTIDCASFRIFGIFKKQLPSTLAMEKLFDLGTQPFGFDKYEEKYVMTDVKFRLELLQKLDPLICYKVYKLYDGCYQRKLDEFYQHFMQHMESKIICKFIFDYINSGSGIYNDLVQHKIIYGYLMDSTKLNVSHFLQADPNNFTELTKWFEYYIEDVCREKYKWKEIQNKEDMEYDKIKLWINSLNKIRFNEYNGMIFMMMIEHIVFDINNLKPFVSTQKQCSILLCCNETIQKLCMYENETFFKFSVFGREFRALLLNCIYYHIL
eukprot:324033_1